jgi:hypothetical protein
VCEVALIVMEGGKLIAYLKRLMSGMAHKDPVSSYAMPKDNNGVFSKIRLLELFSTLRHIYI